MVFIANEKAEPKTFAKLTKCYEKLNKMKTDTFLPIYSNKENQYSTIRFKKNGTDYGIMGANDVYDIECDIKIVNRDDKQFINCYITNLKLVTKAPVIDYGADVEFSSDEDSDSE